jgi:hypothetical protein
MHQRPAKPAETGLGSGVLGPGDHMAKDKVTSGSFQDLKPTMRSISNASGKDSKE